MSYLCHRPSYAIQGCFLRAAAGRIEVWSIFERYNKQLGMFNQRLFVIPTYFLGMFSANLCDLRSSFYASSTDADNNPVAGEIVPKTLQFGTKGWCEGKPATMSFKEDRKFHFQWGDRSFVIDNLVKLIIFIRVRLHRKSLGKG